MNRTYARRKITALLVSLLVAAWIAAVQLEQQPVPVVLSSELQGQYFGEQSPSEVLNSLEVKGRAPKTGYVRAQFGNGWAKDGLCDTRNIVLARDMTDTVVDDQCRVQKGTLHDPYTGGIIQFERGENSNKVQIDHVVALSDAWQKGAQSLSETERKSLANDPLNLLAVDGPANQQKGDGDAATWLPPSKAFRCQYVARQVAVKKKYQLWVTAAEKEAMRRIVTGCTS